MPRHPRLGKLKGLLAEKDMSQRELSKASGVTKSTLQRKIDGQHLFNVEEVLSICKVLNISLADIPDYFNPADNERRN